MTVFALVARGVIPWTLRQAKSAEHLSRNIGHVLNSSASWYCNGAFANGGARTFSSNDGSSSSPSTGCRLGSGDSYNEEKLSKYDSFQAEDIAIVLPMPKLSHAMTHGRIARWHVREGDPVAIYDVLLTVETDSLVEEAYRLDQFAGTVSLLVESQEEAVVARLLAQEGELLPVGRPIAVLCERPEDVPALRER
ncbi:hypothetical protein Agub_g3040, partial [Astrephomene gubernaculifera]